MFGSQKSIALALVSALMLSGCGTSAIGSLNSVSLHPQAASVQTAKVANTVRTQAPAPAQAPVQAPAMPQRQVEVPAPAPIVSTLRVVGDAAMSEEQIAEDSESVGLSVQSVLGQKIAKVGMVRATDGGYAFEVTSGVFEKTTTVYTLAGSTEIMKKVADRANKKALIKGSVGAENVLTVTSANNWLNLGALFNVFTKGRVEGVIKDAAGKAMADVKVVAKSEEGFVFSDVTDAKGEFVIKGLSAGSFKVSVSKTGFQGVADQAVTVQKRRSIKLEGTLSAAE